MVALAEGLCNKVTSRVKGQPEDQHGSVDMDNAGYTMADFSEAFAELSELPIAIPEERREVCKRCRYVSTGDWRQVLQCSSRGRQRAILAYEIS